jgi:dUTP pyrophosphatase
MSVLLRVKLLSQNAKLPTRGSESSAGYDIYSAEDKCIEFCSSASVKTDIAVTVPSGTYGQLAGRSGFTRRTFASVEAGVIDIDYTGPLEVLMFNHSPYMLDIKKGERIAQLLIIKIANPVVIQVNDLQETIRGSNGFGSTGRD